jgi:signal recognition particle subunit SRP19
MRKQEKAIIWPVYFNLAKTRNEGRRVPKDFAIQAPKSLEIQEAARKLGLENEIVPEAGYPKTPWLKTGMILVEKRLPKEQIIKKIAKQLLKIRSEPENQP